MSSPSLNFSEVLDQQFLRIMKQLTTEQIKLAPSSLHLVNPPLRTRQGACHISGADCGFAVAEIKLKLGGRGLKGQTFHYHTTRRGIAVVSIQWLPSSAEDVFHYTISRPTGLSFAYPPAGAYRGACHDYFHHIRRYGGGWTNESAMTVFKRHYPGGANLPLRGEWPTGGDITILR